MIKRGDVFEIILGKKKRSVLICSHDLLNENSHYVLVAPIMSNMAIVYPFEYVIKDYGKVICDQIKSIRASNLEKDKIFNLSTIDMKQIDVILKYVLGVV